MNAEPAGPLAGRRVVEVGDFVRLSGWLLADFGAQVVRLGAGEEQQRDGYFDRRKTCLQLDPEDDASREIIDRLVREADGVVVSLTERDRRLGEAAIAAAREHGVTRVIVTPDGLAAGGRSITDFTAWAMSGVLWTMGPASRPPVVPGGDQARVPVGLSAGMLLLSAMLAGGAAHEFDLSVREALVTIGSEKGVFPYLEDGQLPVQAPRLLPATGVFPCADGYVVITTFSPIQWDGLAGWMIGHGAPPEIFTPAARESPDARFALKEAYDTLLEQFIAAYTMDELTTVFQSLGIPAAPVYSLLQFGQHPLLRDRGMVAEDGHHLRSPLRQSDLSSR
jgi:crotonobetainyl-CoA:carnitine CoA-transferase CaiB-like acyl-CoA transferase